MATIGKQPLLDRTRSVAENGDALSIALAKQDPGEIESAVDDLLDAYDRYASRAAPFSTSFGFDEVSRQPSPEIRDQDSANALASALMDLEVANLLAQAAQATGEAAGAVDSAAIDDSVTQLNLTLQAVQDRPGMETGATRFAFDEVSAAKPAAFQASPDVAAAKAAYLQQISDVYDRLMAETTTLLVKSFKGLDKLEASQIQSGFQSVNDLVNASAAGKIISRVLDAIQRGVKTLQGLIGAEGMKTIQDRVSKNVAEIKKGEKAVQVFLKYSYRVEENHQLISGWTDATGHGIPEIDAGRQKLLGLNQEIVQMFTLCNKIVSTLGVLNTPLGWVIKKTGIAAPLELVIGALYFMVADIALLRGMDYADTTEIVKFVDGTVTISRKALGA